MNWMSKVIFDVRIPKRTGSKFAATQEQTLAVDNLDQKSNGGHTLAVQPAETRQAVTIESMLRLDFDSRTLNKRYFSATVNELGMVVSVGRQL